MCALWPCTPHAGLSSPTYRPRFPCRRLHHLEAGVLCPPISGCHVLPGTTWRSGRSGGSTHPPPEPPVLLKCMRGSLEASLSSSVHSRSHSSSVYTSPDWHRGRGVSRWGWPPHPPQPGQPGSHTGPPGLVQAPQNPDRAPLLVATDCPHLLQTIFSRTLNLSFQCCWGFTQQ